MLSNHKLILDKNCPICGLYANCLKKIRLIDDNTIAYYQNVNRKVFEQINAERAKSEVALVHPRSGKTKYGVDAFIKILTNDKPRLDRFFHLKYVYFLIEKLYRLISFNRKVIVGGGIVENGRGCAPRVHVPYRIAYILIAALFTGLMVNGFTAALDTELGVNHMGWREYAVCFGQIFWQFAVLSIVRPSKRLAYLGNMSTVSIIGGLLLIPLLLVNQFIDLNWLVLLFGFSAIVGTMFLMHVKRCKRLGLPFIVSISWVLFRTIVLVLVLSFLYLS
jgi:hypothetical protein